MTYFVVLDPESTVLSGSTGGIRLVDISAYTGEDDFISVSMPAYPATKINAALSFLDLTSNPTGDFSIGPTDSVAFSASVPALPGADGNVELRLPLSLFTNIDKSRVTGVRFQIKATANCTFRVLRIRACDAHWVYAPVDIDTLYDRVERPPSLDGSATPTSAFPTAILPDPVDFPVVYRADEPSSVADPQPINLRVGASFTTGSLADVNSLAFYFRENKVQGETQVILNGLTMDDLDALGAQPDFGDVGTGLVSWLRTQLTWDNVDGTLLVDTAEGVSYTFSGIPISAEEHLLAIAEVIDTTVRFKIYPLDAVGNITDVAIFDTFLIEDPSGFKRRRGRFGWHTSFTDGDAFLTAIRPREANFGEVVTTKMYSNTPVEGAQLVAGSTASKELVTFVAAAPWGGLVETTASNPSRPGSSGTTYKITGTGPLHGIATNTFWIDDLFNTKVEFDVRFPSSALNTPGSGLIAFLFGEFGRIAELDLPAIRGDVWQHVRIPLNDSLGQTGIYRLVILQSLPQQPISWYLGNVSVKTTVMDWAGRAHSDAWDLGGEWTSFGDTISLGSGGVLFAERGNALQVRGRALRHHAEVHEFTVNPKFAETGRFVWKDEIPAIGAPPPAHTITQTGHPNRRVTLEATYADPYFDNDIIAYGWSFGDDVFEFAPVVDHTYAEPGTYDVVLTVTAKDRATSVVADTVTV